MKRVVNPSAVIATALRDRECRVCGRPSAHVHHLLFRSHGGDDIDGNLIALCHGCHGAVHEGDMRVRRLIIKRLRPAERSYVVSKLGDTVRAAAWAARVYGAPEEEWHE